MLDSVSPLLLETILAFVGLAAAYFFKQFGDTKRVQKFAGNNELLLQFVHQAVLAMEQKSKKTLMDNEDKYEVVFDRTKSFVDNSLSKYNLDNKKITDEYIDTLIEKAVLDIKKKSGIGYKENLW